MDISDNSSPSLEACATATVSYQSIQASSTTISPAVVTRVGCASYDDGFTLYRQDPDLSEIYGGNGSSKCLYSFTEI
jgi:hypothetical protein